MTTRIARNLVTIGDRVPTRNAHGQVVWATHPTGVVAAEWDKDQYEDAVERVCGRILSNRVGRILVDELARPVSILPFNVHVTGQAFAWTTHNRGATARGDRQRYCSDVASTPMNDTGMPIPNIPRGTGGGSASYVEFTPQLWSGITHPGPLLWADEVLLHELVHALANTLGASSCRAAGFNYDTFDEFVAISVVNVYCSHFHRPLRDSHQSLTDVRPTEISEARRDEEDRMMRDMSALMPTFVDRLRDIDEAYAPDNLFRDAAVRGVIPRGGASPRSLHRASAPRRGPRERRVV